MKSLIDIINEDFTLKKKGSIVTEVPSEEIKMEPDEYIEQIVGEDDPQIYYEEGDWEARDSFDYWEDAFGVSDDVVDYISEYADNKYVAGWSSEKSFGDVESKIPQKIKDFIKDNKSEVVYQTKINKCEVWELEDCGVDVNILRFKYHANDNGTDYAEYWYMIAVE